MKLSSEILQNVWVSYKANHDERSRSQLILHYQPLVKYVSKRVSARLPAHIDEEDLASYGLFGLLDAIEKFDLERGIKFETYASLRIKGAIVDELRSIDWIPRSVRSQVREIDQAATDLESTLKRPPTDAEVAIQMGVSLDDFQRTKGQQSFLHVAALDALLSPDGGDSDASSLMNQLQDNRAQSPALAYETEEIKYAVANAVAVLDEREAVVLVLYYYEGLTLAEIGGELNVTESRVCQMHTKAMTEVRNRLAVA